MLRMCLLAQKPILSTTCGMQALIYLCASNFDKEIRVLNGDNGCDLSSSNMDEFHLEHPKSTDLLIDNITGDYHNFDIETKKWMPAGNVGLHSRLEAEKKGKYMIKSIFQSQKSSLLLQKHYETVCFKSKKNYHHWLTEGIPNQFVSACKNNWDIHPFNFVNPSRTFTVLADNARGPVIISLTEKIVATLFTISNEYPASLILLQNFIAKNLFKETQPQKMEIEKLYQQVNTPKYSPLDTFIRLTSPKVRPGSAQTLSHVGFAIKKNDYLEIFDNNAVKSFKTLEKMCPIMSGLNEAKTAPEKELKKLKSTSVFDKTLCLSGQMGKSLDLQLLNEEGNGPDCVVKSKRPQTAKVSGKVERFRKELFGDSDMLSSSRKDERMTSANSKKNNRIESAVLQNVKNRGMSGQSANRTACMMREMLHPGGKKENYPRNEPLWVSYFLLIFCWYGILIFLCFNYKVPGSYSTLSKEGLSNKKVILIKSPNTLSQKLYTSYGKYRNSDPDECRKTSIIRISSPYLYERELEKQNLIENKTKVLGSEKFKMGKPENNYISNYVYETISEPAGNYQFRKAESKEKWMEGKNFRL